MVPTDSIAMIERIKSGTGCLPAIENVIIKTELKSVIAVPA